MDESVIESIKVTELWDLWMNELNVMNKKGKEKDKGWACDLAPKPLIVDRYFPVQQAAIREQQNRAAPEGIEDNA